MKVQYIDRPFSRMLVLYNNTTSDNSGKFILRYHLRGEDGHSYKPQDNCARFDTEDQARAFVPPELHDIGRMPDDDPVIITCFI